MLATNRMRSVQIGAIISALTTILATGGAVLAGVLLVPWLPEMPSGGLDPSWQYAINEAAARHLVFGRDFIWTFGPLGSVYTASYHPATDTLMMAGSVIMALALCGGFAVLAWRRRLLLLLLPVAVALAYLRDVFFLSLPLLLLMLTFRISLPPDDPRHLRPTVWTVACVLLMSGAVGILPLIKGTFLVLAVVLGSLTVLTAAMSKQRLLAFGIALFAVSWLCIGWVVCGQPLSDLPLFFWALRPIVAGYSEAMALSGPPVQMLYWVLPMIVIAGMLLASVWWQKGLARWFLLLGFAFYAFVSFKEGFVRQDGHVIVPAECFLFVGLFLAALLQVRLAIAAAVIAGIGWATLTRSAIDLDFASALTRAEYRVRSTLNGMALRVNSPKALPAAFNQANDTIRRAEPLPNVEGNADLYPFNLSLLFASGLEWSGRPIIQSYSAYTRDLAEANAEHLIGDTAPANILFAITPIDGRLPSLEDAQSWPYLLSRYSIAGAHGNYLVMVRRVHPVPIKVESPGAKVLARANEWIDVPPTSGVVWATVHLQPTLVGELVLAVFKLPEVQIELQLADGRIVQHRYIPEIGEGGFLLSPYVGSTSDFALMAAGPDPGRQVLKVKLDVPKTRLWAYSVTVVFRRAVLTH